MSSDLEQEWPLIETISRVAKTVYNVHSARHMWTVKALDFTVQPLGRISTLTVTSRMFTVIVSPLIQLEH